MYKLYLFDLDGTLLDSDKMVITTFLELFKLYRPDYHPSFAHMLGYSGPVITDTLANEFPGCDVDFMLKEYNRLSRANYDKYVRLFAGAEELMMELNRRKIDFAIITSKDRNPTIYSLELCGITGLVPFFVTGGDVSKPKPDKEGVELAMKHFGITDKKDVVYIGDTNFDYLTAKNAGIDFILVEHSARGDQIEGDYKVKNFSNLLED